LNFAASFKFLIGFPAAKKKVYIYMYVYTESNIIRRRELVLPRSSERSVWTRLMSKWRSLIALN